MQKEKISKVMFTHEEIQQRAKELGRRLSEDYKGENLLLINILKGGVVFLSDLMRNIEGVDVEIDFMCVSSYGSKTVSSGHVQIVLDLKKDIEGKNVVIVEDIIDTGITLNYLLDTLAIRQPKTLEICTFLNKPSRREIDVNVKYIGFDIPDEFVIGYGLDYNERYRNLPYIGVLELINE